MAGEGGRYDAEAKVGCCGDWTAGARAADAFQSGVELAATVLPHL